MQFSIYSNININCAGFGQKRKCKDIEKHQARAGKGKVKLSPGQVATRLSRPEDNFSMYSRIPYIPNHPKIIYLNIVAGGGGQ